jgi:hypothetical protein
MHEGANAKIAANKFFREMRSDKSGSTGDQHFSQDCVPLKPCQVAEPETSPLLKRTAGQRQIECGDKCMAISKLRDEISCLSRRAVASSGNNLKDKQYSSEPGRTRSNRLGG